MSSTSSSTASAASSSSSSTPSISAGSNLKVVGIILAVASGLLIGSSFVFKKKGLLRSQAGHAAGEGVAYLKSPLWWLGMSMMILGELCNFAAYAFVEALVVTPLGALSVVICAILSSIFLKEKLSFFGWLGCALCIVGSIIIALNGPQEPSVGYITDFQKLFLAPGFLAFGSALIFASLIIIFYFAPRYGNESMMWYIAVCSMIGGISVSVTTGLGAAIVTTAFGQNQFTHWFIYFLIVFVIVTLVTEVFYLNKALAIFNTAMVTPTYYVTFTFCSMVTSVVLFQGFKASAAQIITDVLAFVTICIGITILQMSKIDPTEFKKLDRRSTMLLQAARSHTEAVDEKSIVGIEDPGIDALRGSFGTVGSIIRARSARRLSMSSQNTVRNRPQPARTPANLERGPSIPSPDAEFRGNLKRHQLYDSPMPPFSPNDPRFSEAPGLERVSVASSTNATLGTPGGGSERRPTIKFDSTDVVHQYHPTLSGDHSATHEQRSALHHQLSPLTSQSQLMHGPDLGTASSSRQLTNHYPTSPLSLASRQPHPLRHEGLPVDDADGPLKSAPPVLSGLDTSGTSYYRTQVRDPFENTPSTTTLSDFPSLSDSFGSGHGPLYGSDEDESPQTYRRPRHDREYSNKQYPKGDRETDREESVSLWHRPSVESIPDDVPSNQGGIRLVPSGSGNRF
ncbi:hypothetical protein JAAARDRAFT_37090 [Jaapia argillacea MUCL 33604]|uniref:DUF803-domain-containing protein n=1 Tax=Jaapia argillacea MUCL 33604 TaxID=933084 RepID=A0A067PPE1_9AGAM|nr:hypothetical protein JAAARDRAFT_37090 [Jaapia argillacea MUCL 33604]